MNTIIEITNLLVSMKYLCQQGHLTSTSYSDHLLFEKLESDIDEHIDLLKEIAIFAFGKTDIASCADTLKKSSEYIQRVEKDAPTEQCLSYIREIINKIVSNNFTTDIDSTLKSALEDLNKDLYRKGYLIDQRLKQ